MCGLIHYCKFKTILWLISCSYIFSEKTINFEQKLLFKPSKSIMWKRDSLIAIVQFCMILYVLHIVGTGIHQTTFFLKQHYKILSLKNVLNKYLEKVTKLETCTNPLAQRVDLKVTVIRSYEFWPALVGATIFGAWRHHLLDFFSHSRLRFEARK